MKIKSSLHSGIYDVKINHKMVHLVDYKGFAETVEHNTISNKLDTEIALTEANFERHVKCESTSFDSYAIILISDLENGDKF